MCAEATFGSDRVAMVQRIEAIRSAGTFRIGRSLSDFSQGVFDASDKSDPTVFAVAVPWGETTPDSPPDMNAPGCAEAEWSKTTIGAVDVWVARGKA